MAKRTKIWFAHKTKYGYVNLNKKTRALLKQCHESGSIHYCYLHSIEEQLLPMVKEFVDYGIIDERDYK